MDYKFEFLNTQRTTNIILLLITFFIIVFVITFIIISNDAKTVIVRTANNISNVVRPFSQLVQTVSNDIQSVQPLVQQVANNVQTATQSAVQNGLTRVTPEIQRAQQTIEAIPEKINAVVNDPLARQAYNDLVSKIREIFAKKGKFNADELIVERYMKKLKKIEAELEKKSMNEDPINIDHYERRLARFYDSFYKDTKSKYVKILATKHIK